MIKRIRKLIKKTSKKSNQNSGDSDEPPPSNQSIYIPQTLEDLGNYLSSQNKKTIGLQTPQIREGDKIFYKAIFRTDYCIYTHSSSSFHDSPGATDLLDQKKAYQTVNTDIAIAREFLDSKGIRVIDLPSPSLEPIIPENLLIPGMAQTRLQRERIERQYANAGVVSEQQEREYFKERA